MSALADLAGKVAVVTGGASGIGKGLARELLAQGMQVVIADVELDILSQTATELGATPVATDVSSLSSVENLAAETVRRFGTVHVLCNNAGVGSLGRIADMKPADWDWLLNVNVKGVIHGITTFLPILKRNPDGGHIINTSSLSGFTCLPGLGGYTLTKFAVLALTETLALELAEENSKVGVTALCPGTVRTNLGSSSRNRPAALAAGGLVDSDLEKTAYGAQFRWLEPETVGAIAVRAMRRGDLYAFTHPDMRGPVDDRHKRIALAMDDAAEMLSGLAQPRAPL